MTIPTLSTSDKLFICSYNIGSNIDHRKGLGIINEITTFTSEYIDGFCWIPVNCTDNDDSWYWDEPEKDVVYVKVGVRVSSDGYLHAWLLNTQKVSELILWNNNYNTTNQPIDDTTTLHWSIEKMYRLTIGNTTSFIPANIKFQKYGYASASRLYLFGNNNNSLINALKYDSSTINVYKSDTSWYPNNSTAILGDILSTGDINKNCSSSTMDKYDYASATKVYLYDGTSYTDYTDEYNKVSGDPVLAPKNVGDKLYIGYGHKFFKITIDVTQAGTNGGITWSSSDIGISFTIPGVQDDSFNLDDFAWFRSTVNGENLYWVCGTCDTDYTIQAEFTGDTIGISKFASFSQSFLSAFGTTVVDPKFWYVKRHNLYNESIPAVCNPTDPITKTISLCHQTAQVSNGIGNNSGRIYTVADPSIKTACSGDLYDCGTTISVSQLDIDYSGNRAYIFVPAHCSISGHSNQTDCEAAGGTWIPGTYICDPTFTYDTSILFYYSYWNSIIPDKIDYSDGSAYFGSLPINDGFWMGSPGNDVELLCQYYSNLIIDTFHELLNDDLDELKHSSYTGDLITSTTIYTIFTKHVGLGLLTDAALTITNSNWEISWGTNNYFSNWQTPDGLSVRDPGHTNTPYTRALTYKEEFNVGSDMFLGGYFFDLLTSDGFLSRNPGTETVTVLPVYDNEEFNYKFDLLTSDGFLSRNPGTETVTVLPVYDNEEFNYKFDLIRPAIADLYHLELTGNDSNDGTSWIQAWKTWTHAMQNTPDERTLLVEEGTYNIGETQVEPDNSIVIYLVKNHVDDVSTVTVTI